jgi:hypothetical protein
MPLRARRRCPMRVVYSIGRYHYQASALIGEAL